MRIPVGVISATRSVIRLDVGLRQGRIPVVGEHQALAAHLVGGGDLAAQLGIGDRLVDLPPTDRAERREQPAPAGHRHRAELHEAEHRGPVEPLKQRVALEQALRSLGVLEVHLREGPAGRALVHVHLLDDRLDAGHDLDRATARAQHGHALAGELHVVAPLGGVEGRPLEAVEPRQRRDLGHGQLAAGGEEHVGLVAAGARLEQPAIPLLVPVRPLHLRAGAHALQHPVTLRDLLEVGLDLRPRRIAARPARVRREGELVEVRGDVAGGPRIGVVVPDAADPLAALEDRDVVVARPAQHHGGSDAAEAAAHHGH